jgi:pyruvate/2-oxoglutarate dehydrogenase complex dihydrolipoamide dehydrogenase (E3) component
MGVDVRTGAEPGKTEMIDVWPGHAGPVGGRVRMWLSDGGILEADRVLVACGRLPRVEGLSLEELGVDVRPGEGLPVDETCRVPATGMEEGGVWAAGDVTGMAPSAHVARYQARVVAAGLRGERRAACYRAIPRVVRTRPAVRCVGAGPSPDRAAEPGIEILTAGYDLAATARAAGRAGERGRVELYADGSRGVLVGAAAAGPYAEEWMSEIALAVRAETPLALLTDVVHGHPGQGEAIEAPLRELAALARARSGGDPSQSDRPREDAR